LRRRPWRRDIRPWPAGADAVETFEKKGHELIDQANAYRELSSSLAIDDAADAS
jgi:hypothetical protein